ncbi:MAG: ABC transporter ATP-binding protein [Clostridiaceae bacterium]|jgi:energy-coupling factor transport system ATP-binding protein|nr:ABC transporter ATP-binding protein [Eubacteriales bacterium]NLV49040.1 ABC transporter ATP-binding protein [Clostridiaceae bacterium]
MSYIELKNVSFEYPGGFLAVDDISMSIEKGENVAIVGQNGAGKTTTVKLLNALHYPTKGDVLIGDMNTRKFTTAQVSRRVGYVFQNPDDQIFHSTIIDEVAFGPKMMRLPDDRQKQLVNKALSMTGMKRYRHENPYNLPLSVRKFVTIASIIAMDCDVMVFDEPTAGQDYVGNKRLAKIIRTLSEQGKTLITISHDMVFVADHFPRIIVMSNKKIIADGTPQDVFWNLPILEEAMLKQPYVSRICHELGVGDRIIRMDEAVDAIAFACGIKEDMA